MAERNSVQRCPAHQPRIFLPQIADGRAPRPTESMEDVAACRRGPPMDPQPDPDRPNTSPTAGQGQVRLADRTVSVSDLKQHPDRYTGLFGRARSEVGHAVCLCRSDQEIRLVIRCRSGRYHLALWPAGGHQHDPGCSWYRSPSSMSGRSTYEAAIRTTDDGTTIRLAAPLTLQGISTAPPATPTAATPGSEQSVPTTRRSMGLLALLHYLWESAQLNVWHPHHGHRRWHTCQALLAEQARDCRVNRTRLTDTLWIVPPFKSDHAERINAAWERFLNRLTIRGHTRHRGLVLGEIRNISPTDYGVRMSVAHQRAPLYASTQLMDQARQSYPAVFSERAGEAGRRQVVLCLVERARRGYPVIKEIAAMLTTHSYIPVESSHEARMADALATAGRAFVKPLHYAGEDQVFPDFVLIDGDTETFVEVWGVQGRADYEARKRAKQDIYRATGRTLLEWDVRDPLPGLAR
ncbi:DUF1173 family protein [Saccharopolyspora griseoalba]|uniref:DUF1173 family protein n=1 Tax=Saccharopolyspora griseoalba TaxID=1431848 RepID=A0ABW2LTN6_9PSEU